MKTSLLPQGMRSIGRRGFVKTAGGAWVISLLPRARLLGGAEVLQVLRGENLERLRLDFNAGRGKVRILSVLSPT